MQGERVVGVRGQVEKADIEIEGFKNGMRSQRALLVGPFAVHGGSPG